MQQANRREYKNQKAPRLAGLLEKYLYKSITYRLNGGAMAQSVNYLGNDVYAYNNGLTTMSFNVSFVDGSYSDNLSRMQSTPWWGDKSIATLFNGAAQGPFLSYARFGYDAGTYGGGDDCECSPQNVVWFTQYANGNIEISSSLMDIW